MNGKNYLEWWNYHIAVLPSIGKWFDGLDDAEVIHKSWKAALSTTAIKDACAATDAIVAGVLDRPFPEETAAVVRRFAAERTLSRREEQREPDGNGRQCQLCRNTGHVTIWNPLIARGVHTGVDRFRNPANGEIFRVIGPDGDVRRLEAVAPCKCSFGDRFAFKTVKRGDHLERVEVGRYDPSSFHAAVTFRTHEERKSMTIREQVQADLEAAGISSGVTEWDF